MVFDEASVRYKNFHLFPEPVLRSMAVTHLFQIASVNHPKSGYKYNAITAMPDGGHTCVRAERGHLALNFASTVIQGMVIADLAEIEGILWEARRVITLEGDYPPSIIGLYDDLEHETADFLDYLGGSPAMNVKDILYSANQAAHDLHLTRV